MPETSALDVLLHGAPIGTLTPLGGDRTIFAFNDSYVADPGRAVLSLAFKDRLGTLIRDLPPTQTRLLPFFSNVLPEGHLRTYLAKRAGVKPVREFFLLRALGLDLPGAITVISADDEGWPPAAGERHGDAGDTHEMRDGALRFSLAGVQLKLSAVIESQGGLTIPAKGVGGSQIVKLPSRSFEGLPENEFSMLTLARLVGIDVPPVRLVDVAAIENMPDGLGDFRGQALAVERFDRLADGSAVHIEDFAQVFGVYPEEKYARASYRNIASVIATEGSQADIAEFIRRLVFNALIGNADMHLKNWSMRYADRRSAALAPAYDFVSTIAYLPDANAALKFSRTKRFDGLSADELSHLAARASLPEKLVLDTAHETVALFHERWASEKKNLRLSREVVEVIDRHVRTVPIANVTP